MIESVLLPQTYLARGQSEILACWFDDVHLLRPPDLSQEQGEMTDVPPEVFKILEVSQNSEDIGLPPASLQNLMYRWEGWISSHGGTGDLDTIKAGIKPHQPDLETTRAIMQQIIGGAQPARQPERPPSVSPGLVLKLAHLLEKQMGEVRSLTNSLATQQVHMAELLEMYQDEDSPAEFEKIDPNPTGPMGLVMEDESLADYRLKAWASLAPFEKKKNLTSLTLSPQAALLLLERANFILGGKPVGSADGAQSLLWAPVSLSMAGTTLAREMLRMRLPGPTEADEFKQALGEMLEALKNEPLSMELIKFMQYTGDIWLVSGGAQQPGSRLALMAFPGYSLAGLLEVMKGRSAKPDSPGTSCPLWVLWSAGRW
jgi:hypothetical protein